MADHCFSLHPKLAEDTLLFCQFAFSDLRVMNDSRFPWFILVPRIANISEWFDLSEDMQHAVFQEAMAVAHALKQYTHADKINIAALGNQVSQLHIHIIARFRDDAAWPNPVWNSGKPVPYTPQALEKLKEKFSFSYITHL